MEAGDEMSTISRVEGFKMENVGMVGTVRFDWKDRKVVVYSERNKLSELLGAWFVTHKVNDMTFRCATWTWLKKQVSDIEAAKITSLLGLDNDVHPVFSHKAGCNCGCSPGFVLKTNGRNIHSLIWSTGRVSSVCVTLEPTAQDLVLVEAACLQADKRLVMELSLREVKERNEQEQKARQEADALVPKYAGEAI